MPCDTTRADALFDCTQCGECCKGYGGTYVTATDIHRIAEFLQLSEDTVRQRYCVFSGRKPLLVQADNGYCVFWDRICTIHPVKPRMCRQWPFIPSVLADPVNWRIMASCCPGIRPDVGESELKACVRQALESEPSSITTQG